mgnify:FL=1
MTIPLYDHQFQGYYGLIPYYNINKEGEVNIWELTRTVESVISDAFRLSIDYITDSVLCPGCMNEKLTPDTRQSLRHIYKLR